MREPFYDPLLTYEENYKFSITGVGGVTKAKDYFEYKKTVLIQ